MKDGRHVDRPGLIRLVRASARGERDLRIQAFDEDTIRWAIETGLAPLLVRATADDPDAVTSPLWPLLQGANLTARLLSALQMDAMAEIIDACRGEVPPLVLLKGISMCEHDYPEPHLRPMRDLDFLVEDDWTVRVEAILTRLGYVHRSERSDAFYATHHHVAPFFHADTGIWVDVHRALFGPRSELGADGVFTLQTLKAELRPSRFRGRVVRRLSDDLQLVHVACHWAHGLRVVGGMIAMADISYLLNSTPSLRWGQILRWMDGSAASRHLCLLLTYLDKRGLIDVEPDIIRRLYLRQSSFDRFTMALGHLLLDRYVVGGHDFGAVMSEMNFQRLWRIAVLRKRPSRNFGLRSAWRLRSRSSPAATVSGPR
jgi:hypothetical protein